METALRHRKGAPGFGNGAPRLLGDQSGVSLIVVLWVMALLMVIVTEFAYSMRVEGSSAMNFKDEAAARSLAEAGVNLAISEIMEDYESVGLDAEGRLLFFRKDSGALAPAAAARELELGGGKVVYSIEDENGKINVNRAQREQIIALLMESGVDVTERDVIADSILDWRDPNHEYHLNGAEDDYYESLERPYSARDANFETVEELLLVKGVTREIFYGPDDPARGPFRPEGGPSADEAPLKGIARHVTVSGDGRINPNTAGRMLLAAVYGRAKADDMIARRGVPGAEQQGGVRSTAFTIVSRGEVGGIRVGIRAVVEKKGSSASTGPAAGQGGANQLFISYWKEEGTVAD